MKLHDLFMPAFLPYKRYWDDWVISDYCFLTTNEIEITMRFENNPSVDLLAAYCNKSSQTMRYKLKRIIRKLISGKKVYDEWIIKYKAGTDQQDYPLHVPVTCLPLSTRLKTTIYQAGNSLHDVLNYTQGDLTKLRRFGSGHQQELEQFLQSCGISLRELINTVYLKNYAA
jgi:hypothetical protein